MFIIRHTDGSIERSTKLEIPKVFHAIPAVITTPEEDWGVYEEEVTIEKEHVEELEVDTTLQDKTFSPEAYITVGQDEPLQNEAFIDEADIPKQLIGKKNRR